MVGLKVFAMAPPVGLGIGTGGTVGTLIMRLYSLSHQGRMG